MIEAEARDLADLRFRISEQMISANALLAEQNNGTDATSSRARIAALEKERVRVDQEAAAKRSALATLRARSLRVEDRIRAAQIRFETLSQRATDLAATTGTRTDQVRLIDPGVVPQQPSFPRPTLFVTAAFLIALMLSLIYLTLQFGLQRQQTTFRESELRVARGNR